MEEKLKITKIYFDMDGVLADFERGVRELCTLEPVNQSKATNAQTDRLWEAVKKVPHFYLKLEPMKDAVEFFNEVFNKLGGNCQILTGIPKPRRQIENAGEDKIEWVRKFLPPDVKVNVVFRKEKIKFCTGENCILIDDYDKNIREWEKAGGRGILFTSVEMARAELEKIGFILSSSEAI